MNPCHDLRAVARQFQICGDFIAAEPYGNGHINDTYCVAFDQAGTRVRYLFQRINHNIFKNPPALMENIQRVTGHLGRKSCSDHDRSRRGLALISTRHGHSFHRDADGNYWRAYFFIEKAHTCDAVESPQQAFEAAKAFGRFQTLLADLPAPPLHDTIPDFHHTPKRFAALETAIQADAVNRAKCAKAENELARKVCRLTGSRSPVKYAPERPGDVKHSIASVGKLRSAGFISTSNFASGLKETVEFFSRTPAT